MTVFLRSVGYQVNRKRTIRLMRQLVLQAVHPKQHTSQPNPKVLEGGNMMTGGFKQWMRTLEKAKKDSAWCEREGKGKKKQVYAVVHDGQGKFLICKKNQKGYFFHEDKRTRKPVLVREGQSPLNGSNKWAFPGGAIVFKKALDQYDQSILAALLRHGAVKEFFEETNALLEDTQEEEPQGYDLNPPIFKGLHNGQLSYFGVYFDVDTDFLEQLCSTIQDNLNQGYNAANAVQNSFQGDYNQLREQFLGCPQDNELASIEIWNFTQHEQQIQELQNDNEVSWYFYILNNLRTQLSRPLAK